MSKSIHVLFDRHGGGGIAGTTASRGVAQKWHRLDPAYHHVVEYRHDGNALQGGAVVYVLHDRHGDGGVQGVTCSKPDADKWCAHDGRYRVAVATVLEKIETPAVVRRTKPAPPAAPVEPARANDIAPGFDDSDTLDLKIHTNELDTVRRVLLFQHLGIGEITKVLEIVSRAQRFEKGEIVLREGEPAGPLYLILEGRFAARRDGELIAFVDAGLHFGEAALFGSRPRSATVAAVEPSRVLVIERAAFNDLVLKEPQLAVKLLWAFSQVLSLRLDAHGGALA
jgi:hypothetical protein